MKIYAAVAMLITLPVHAGNLLPMSGQTSNHMRDALTEKLQPTVAALPEAISVEPILESIEIHGRGKRFWFGPLAGSSHIVLRIRITDGETVTEEVISTKNGAWKGTFKPGQDYAMIDRVVAEAKSILINYSAFRLTAK